VTPPRRILFPFVGDTVGGSHISAIALARGLDRRLFEPTLLLHESGRLSEYLTARGAAFLAAPNVPVVCGGPIHKRIFDLLRCTWTLSTYLRAHRIAAVHTNDMRMHLTWGLAARTAGVPFIWHQRTMAPIGPTELFSTLADDIIVVSECCRQSFAGRGRHRAKLIPDPFHAGERAPDRAAARAAILNQISAAPGTRLVAFVANLMAQKRPLIFVEAAAKLKERFGDRIRFLMFGEERQPIADEVRARIAALGLQGSCRLMGPRFPIEPWLAGCDVLLAPAVDEAFGRTLVEAMLVGTPVVAAAVGGHTEIIRHGVTGMLTPADDPRSLAGAAIEILEDPARAAALVHTARPLAVKRYSAESHVAAVQSVYRALLG
jgi:glycosyltransferase involved in cell wall biosynthesis